MPFRKLFPGPEQDVDNLLKFSVAQDQPRWEANAFPTSALSLVGITWHPISG